MTIARGEQVRLYTVTDAFNPCIVARSLSVSPSSEVTLSVVMSLVDRWTGN